MMKETKVDIGRRRFHERGEGPTLNRALGHLHARWNKSTIGGGTNIAGRTPPISPAWTANLGATYPPPVSDGLKIDLHFDARYMDKFQWSLDYKPISGTTPLSLHRFRESLSWRY